MKFKKIICLMLAVISASAALTGCSDESPKAFDTTSIVFSNSQLNEIETKIDEILNVNDFHGGVSVKLNKNVIYSSYVGEENSIGDKIDENTVFLSGSLTRAFTGAAVYQLIDAKKLSLNTPVSKFFSGKNYLTQITIKDLLNSSVCFYPYTSSVSSDDNLYKKIDNAYKKKDDERIKRLIAANIIAKGIDKEKTNAFSNYFILGLIIEKVSGKTYKEYIKAEFFDKLGMKNSGFVKTGGSLKGFDMNNKQWRRQSEYRCFTSYGLLFSSFGITTTVPDAVTFFSALLEGKLSKTDIVKAALNSGTGYNCGFSSDGRNIFIQSKLLFSSAYVKLNYEDRETVVLISNYTGKTDIGETGSSIAQTVRTKVNGIVLNNGKS